MNQSTLLHIVERLEGFVGKLPEAIQRPILRELTPLKELFLQQRSPRFVFIGNKDEPVPEIMARLFAASVSAEEIRVTLADPMWQKVSLGEHGTISVLDARKADAPEKTKIRKALNEQPPDVIFGLIEGKSSRRKSEMPEQQYLEGNQSAVPPLAIGIVTAKDFVSDPKTEATFTHLFHFPPAAEESRTESRELMSFLARQVPNEARIEMIRISRDREAQREIAQSLVKSTAAVCTAIGAQPIPLADLPILTTLQLVMVSGIMYVSGRERSLRAATEFIGALGANVGAGMLLREGTRALLKFFPGWGNVICGMVAGAGTYAIGRAAIVFFLEGVSLKDARRIYLSSRKRPVRPALAAPGQTQKTGKRKK
jgi:uncharacterized protein (DUF697 family)